MLFPHRIVVTVTPVNFVCPSSRPTHRFLYTKFLLTFFPPSFLLLPSSLSLTNYPTPSIMSFNLPRSLSRTAWRSYGTVQGSPSAASIASRVPSVLVEATSATAPRTNWTPEEVSAVYHTPLNQLTYASVRIPNYKIKRSIPSLSSLPIACPQ